jgi:anti-sigma factor RsiW
LGEADLQAYIDGQLDMPGRIEVERWLHAHPEAAAEAMEGLRLRDEVRLFLADEGWAPPAATVGQARNLARRLAGRKAGVRLPQALAATILVGAGWFAHAELGLFVDPVAAAHPVPAFAAEAARSLDTLPARLGGAEAVAAPHGPEAPRTGGEVPVPPLGDSLRLVGSDLVGWQGGTALVALYRTTQGDPITLFAGEAAGFDVLWPRSATVQGHTTVFWQTGPYAYALSGGVEETVLLELAREAGFRPWASFLRTSPTQGAPHG